MQSCAGMTCRVRKSSRTGVTCLSAVRHSASVAWTGVQGRPVLDSHLRPGRAFQASK